MNILSLMFIAVNRLLVELATIIHTLIGFFSNESRSQQISELFDLAVSDTEEIGRGSFNTVVHMISLDKQKKACKRIEKKTK